MWLCDAIHDEYWTVRYEDVKNEIKKSEWIVIQMYFSKYTADKIIEKLKTSRDIAFSHHPHIIAVWNHTTNSHRKKYKTLQTTESSTDSDEVDKTQLSAFLSDW